MTQLQSPTYTKGITESTILVGEPDMGVLQNGMAATECFIHHIIAFLCGFGCRVKGHSNGIIDNSAFAGWTRLPSRIHVPICSLTYTTHCKLCSCTNTYEGYQKMGNKTFRSHLKLHGDPLTHLTCKIFGIEPLMEATMGFEIQQWRSLALYHLESD
jgi:hypothetical protein